MFVSRFLDNGSTDSEIVNSFGNYESKASFPYGGLSCLIGVTLEMYLSCYFCDLLMTIEINASDDFRLFCGDLGNEVTDDILIRTFNRYPSFQKAKVVRDKRTNKTKGFGFVSFKDPSDFARAMREINGLVLFDFSCFSGN